jgi:hypothetical protein
MMAPVVELEAEERPVTARARVPKARVDEVREAVARDREAPAFRRAAGNAKAEPWLKPAPKLSERIRKNPAPFVIAAIASAVAIATFLKGRKSA